MRSIRSRLLLAIMLPMLVILPVVGVLLNYLLQTQIMVAGISNELIRQAVLVADISSMSVELWQNPSEAQAFVARISPRLTAKLMLLDASGHLIISSDPDDAHLVGAAYEMPDLQRLMAMETPVDVQYNRSQITSVMVPAVTRDGRIIGFVRLANPLADVYKRSEQLSKVILYVVIGGILAGIVLALILSRDVERPLKRTSGAVNQLANGKASCPIKEEGPEEVRVLVRAFNHLAVRLQTSEENRQRLLANTVHELGRPLGALLSALQALRGGADEQVELRKELLEGMETEIGVLQHLLQDLAHLYDSGSGQVILERHMIDISEWLPRVLRTWEEAALEKGLKWEISLPQEPVMLKVDAGRVAQALENLVSNAIRYTPSGGYVKVGAAREDSTLLLCVEDNGPGIDKEEQSNIFQPFYRGSAAHRFSEGMGLGLTIARDLVQAHGGALQIESQPGKGSLFSIRLPIYG